LTVALITLSVTGGMDRAVSLIRANIEETQRNNSTWSWRVNGFAEATDRLFSSDTFEIMVGPPSGRDLRSSAHAESIYIHNQYIATVAYYGVVGGLILVIWLFAVARELGGWIHKRPEDGKSANVRVAFLEALLLSQLTYFVAYQGRIVQGSITALIWLAARSRLGKVIRAGERKSSLDSNLPTLAGTCAG
jgi:hypothetical protein